jgi:sugar phosphate isomerase/epimerase
VTGGTTDDTPRAGRLRLGYGTSGFADHRLDDAVTVLAGLGYEGIALTLDHHHLDPFAPDAVGRARALRRRLDTEGMAVVVETGARYVLDPWRKHSPTLLDDDPTGRLEYLRRAVVLAAELQAEAMSFWAGTAPAHVDVATARGRLVDGCHQVLETARRQGVTVGLEPEPGMLVQDVPDWFRLWDLLGRPDDLGITLDVGHCQCLDVLPVADRVAEVAPHLVNVQIEDMRRGVHEHLEFGEGELDVPAVLEALVAAGYRGLVSVELSRHSHAAPAVARRSLEFLRAAARSAGIRGPAAGATR